MSAPLNYRHTPPEIDHALEVSRASLLVHHVDATTTSVGARVPNLRLGTIRCSDDAADDRAGRSSDDLLTSEPGAVTLPPMRPDSPLFEFFTSGSTGPAKGVTHTLDTLGWMAANLVQSLEVTPDDVVLTTTSHSYLGGTSWGLMALAAGAPRPSPHRRRAPRCSR